MEATCSILHVKGLPKFLKVEVINIMVHVLNYIATKTLVGSTPYEQWSGKQPNISYF
jgi:hypothetical protein